MIIPFAVQTKTRIPTQGRYPVNFPEGAIIHYTAGRCMKGDVEALLCVDYLARRKYPCLVISRTGTVFQSFDITEWGFHSGTVHHKTHLGIELMNSGKLTMERGKFRSWFGEYYDLDQVRFVESRHNIAEGWYLKCSDVQEQTLIRVLTWLHETNSAVFSIDKIWGHDSICRGRKTDPGGCLSFSIPELRQVLRGENVGLSGGFI